MERHVRCGNSQEMNRNFEVTRNKNLLEISSLKPTNQLAPIWKFSFWFYNLNDRSLIEEIRKILIEKEKDIVSEYRPYNDGGTGLGIDTVTSRYNSFNLFRIQEKAISTLKVAIGNELSAYLDDINFQTTEDFSPMINCWFNIMKPGQQINQHSHNLTNNSFLSGHVTISCEDSHTYYITPYTKDKLEFVNNIGEGIFFPSYIEHGTSVHNGVNNRITLAFDIYYNIDQSNATIRNNLVDLYD